MELLILLVLAGAAVLVLPLLLIKVLFALVVLPFKILGGLLHGAGVLAALAFKVLFGVIGLVLALLAALVALVLLPLLPLALVALVVWLVVRAARKPDLPRLTA